MRRGKKERNKTDAHLRAAVLFSISNLRYEPLSIEHLLACRLRLIHPRWGFFVVIGGSFAGILSTHEIFKAIPTAKVTVINPYGEVFFNIAAPRILAKRNAIKPQDYLLDIDNVLGLYPSESFTLSRAE
jgi:hypothetical protein